MKETLYYTDSDRRRPVYRRFSLFLALYFVASILVPNIVLAYTEHYSVWTTEALVLMPLGFYLMWSVALRRSGVMIWLGFPFIFFAAFQIVLLYLFGNSIIATDMFTNVLTTNPGEATELLGNIYPAVLLVAVMYLPMLWLAWREIGHRYCLPPRSRRMIALVGGVLFVIGAALLIPAYRGSDDKHVIRDEIFPLNVVYNMYLCGSELRKTYHFEEMTADFRFDAQRSDSVEGRELYVYVIGEAARAMNWQLYGYERETTPGLMQIEDLIIYRNVLTQSNTTHKSVPLFLSSVATHEHEALYRRKGLPALFREAGFETWFISNQSPQGAMIDNLSQDAEHVCYLEDPRHDMQLLDQLKQVVAESQSEKLFVILHCYGSHFSYHQRYPRSEAFFLPDDDVAIRADHAEELRNAYDNSIRYTDRVLTATVEYLRSLTDCTSALLYCSDHGEDLYDDDRGRFLHASPTTTAYQLYVASFAWFSERYRAAWPEKVATAATLVDAPATTHSMYHTIADIASVEGRFCNDTVSLVNPAFDRQRVRRYLNDHNEAVPFSETGLTEHDWEIFARYGVVVD
ncbi:MAG: lipid A phosphoethanolamine transferase [Rikenellaceae bacterium]|nr:lipid A phosphoethanolamine transferase [Rikenellaceae bacterium]